MRRAEVDPLIDELRAHGLDAIRIYGGKRGYLISVRRADGTSTLQSTEEAEALLAKVKVVKIHGS